MPTLSWRSPAALPAAKVQEISSALGISPVTAMLIMRRGYTNPHSAMAFLRPSPAQSYDPYLMKGMSALAGRVHYAIKSREPILIFGDYDADGIPGTALLAIYLRRVGANVRTFIPNREDGYGLTMEAASRLLLLKPQPKLIVTVDCGSPDHEAIAFLRRRKIDVAVTDHHLTLKGPPPTPYFINPARSDDETYPYRALCGCGVVYKLVQALSTRAQESRLYELVAISTIGDQVPLTGENRYYVKAALSSMHRNATGNLGLRAIASTAAVALATINPTHIGWRICPRINAVGRMGADPNLVVELLSTSDHNRAAELAAMLQQANGARQTLTSALYDTAMAQVTSQPPDALLVAYLPGATVGVLGLMASKIVENYHRPALVVNGEGRGSGRAPEGQEIMSYMHALRGVGVFGSRSVGGRTVTADYGGHSAACGFHNVDPGALMSAAKNLRVPSTVINMLRIDDRVALSALTPRLAAEIDQLAPFGIGNPEPRLLVTDLATSNVRASRSGQTLLFSVSDGQTSHNAFWYGQGSRVSASLPARVDMLVTPIPDGSGGVDLQVLGLRLHRRPAETNSGRP